MPHIFVIRITRSPEAEGEQLFSNILRGLGVFVDRTTSGIGEAYAVTGEYDKLVQAQKVLRRLQRGKPKFKVNYKTTFLGESIVLNKDE
ncbi:hypothetical protein LCGC14_2534120 [marine sediment metagenome]|uniref:Uncharacterized protein n=1 Tax=marine sediment metagenome TaxID=412755 RepID=A0A0F9BFJ5_9ZZZZ